MSFDTLGNYSHKEVAALKAELKAINAAIDMPECDLTLTAVECIKKLQAELAALKAQLAEVTQERDDFEQARDLFEELNTDHWKQLAAAQAREQMLRETLQYSLRVQDFARAVQTGAQDRELAHMETILREMTIKAFSLSSDDIALREYGAKLLEEFTSGNWAGLLLLLDAMERKAAELRSGK